MQQDDSIEDMDDDHSSSGTDESFTIEVRYLPKVLHTQATRAAEFIERMKSGVHQSHISSWHFEGRQGSPSGAKRDETMPVDHADSVGSFGGLQHVDPTMCRGAAGSRGTQPLRASGQVNEGSAALHPATLL
jgi:hypothetical protein